MLEEFKKHLALEKFFQDGNEYKVGKQTYHISYPEFLKYFDTIESISKHNLIIGINFVYWWMPTIFDFRSDNFDEVVEILNDAKKWLIPTIEQLNILKWLFKNSLVGTSKLLHFINPDKFAIRDSRVYYYLTGKTAYKIGDCEAYLSYLAFCGYLTQEKEYEKMNGI